MNKEIFPKHSFCSVSPKPHLNETLHLINYLSFIVHVQSLLQILIFIFNLLKETVLVFLEKTFM